MGNIAEHIERLVNGFIDREDIFLVGVNVTGNNAGQKVQVLLDGDSGIGVGYCSFISRKLANELEEKNLIENKYILEVSSPGIDSPLVFERQYPQHIGRKLSLELSDGQKLKGELTNIKNGVIVILAQEKAGKKSITKEVEVPLNTIKVAKVLVSF